MAFSTALDLIKLASKMAGVLAAGQTPIAEDATDALNLANVLLQSWNQDRWMIYRLRDVSCLSVGKPAYTIGPGGDFDAPRPDSLESAYVRLLNSNGGVPAGGTVDFPLLSINTHEEYGGIALKQLVSFPVAYFYDPTLTLGTLYFYPIPNETFELHVVVKDALQKFERLTDQIAMPPEYQSALLYNLALRIQMLFQLPVSQALAAEAKRSINIIANANTRVPMLDMPAGLAGRSGAVNPNSLGGLQEGVFTLDEDLLG